jgi:hypothetical protein
MNKPGMLNIPRAGKKLEKMVAGADLPKPPGFGEGTGGAPSKPKSPTPPKPTQPAAAPEGKVNLPKAPKKVTPPKPQVTITAAPSPTKPTQPKTMTSPAPTQGKKRIEPREVTSAGKVSLVHEGGRAYRLQHSAGYSVNLPWNPKKTGDINEKAAAKLVSDVAGKQPEATPPKPKTVAQLTERQKEKAVAIYGGTSKKDPYKLFVDDLNKAAVRRSEKRATRLVTEFGNDASARDVFNINRSGGRQIAISKGLGLMNLGLGAVGMAPSIVRLARGASLGSLAGPPPGTRPQDIVYTMRDKKTGKTYKIGGSWS